MQLSPSFLNKLIKGERAFTERTIEIMAEKIPLDPESLRYYRLNLKSKSAQFKKEQVYHPMDLDEFQLISDWYHFAILELTTLPGFDPEPKAVAQSLGISVHQASVAIESLIRLGRLRVLPSGRLELTQSSNTIIGPEIALPATRNQQTQILELAVRAMEEVPIERRSQTSMTLALPTSRLPEAKALLSEFRRKFTDLLQRPPANNESEHLRDAVYQLSLSFFPLTPTKPFEGVRK